MLSLLYLSRQVSELSVIRPGELSLQFQFLIIKHTVIILGQRLDILHLISKYHESWHKDNGNKWLWTMGNMGIMSA